MKNKLKILALLLAGIFILPTCQKESDLRMPEMKKGVISQILKDDTKDQVIFDNNLAGFAGKVTVNLLYPGDKPQKVDLMVSMNDDPDNSGTAIANIASFPASYDLTVAKLIDILPGLASAGEIQAGDYFRVYCNITLADGTFINGNDTLYTAYSSGISNLPNSSPNVIFPVACGYESSLAIGDYYAYSAPDQWNSAGDVTITLDPVDNTIVYVAGLASIDGLDEDGDPVKMKINPLTFGVVATKTVICSDFWGYTNGAYEGTGTFDSCTGTYTMFFKITAVEGTFGTFKYTLTRN